ncbi:hypothetical protein BYT27DRAFT_7260221 [Phlegmacium glaucopus]|nr:hypothetical protein BYT27DRAFT_7260221 [Phlegmacium glaucopus]
MKSVNASPILRLPLETLEVFIGLASVSSQLSLACVSQLFHTLTLRWLYRDIALYSPNAVVACCRTLAANPTAATSVRSLLITYSIGPYANSFLSAYYRLIQNALRSLPELQIVKLLVHDAYFITLINQCTFPSLRHVECYLKLSNPLIKFLNRHPGISYLQVSPHEDTSFLSDNTFPTLSLPKLQYFAGNGQSVPVISVSTLRAAIVSWDAVDTAPDVAIKALERSSFDTLTLLSCRRRGWNLDLFQIISNHLPDILSLHISNVLLVDENPTESYLQAIRNILRNFTRLRILRINCIDYWQMGDVKCQLDKDFATVTEWGEGCSSLVEITLPHSNGLSWYRIRNSLWIPDPRHNVAITWLRDALILKQIRWDVVLDELEQTLCKSTANPNEYSETITAVRHRFGTLLQGEK